MDKKLYLKKKIDALLYALKTGGFGFIADDSLHSLRRKMNLYFLFSPNEKKKYAKEISFINNIKNIHNNFSFVFPYSFSENYDYNKIKVFKDIDKGLFFVLHEGKKLYFHRNFKNENAVKYNYNFILAEQDKESPHRYMQGDFDVFEGDIVLDIGCAEASLPLELVEKVKEIHIFEADPVWKEALEATFEPWKNKVFIYNKYVSNVDNQQCLKIDTVMVGKKVDFIKIDVEGVESTIIEGAMDTINNNQHLKIALCTYHRNGDDTRLSTMLHQLGFKTTFSSGYMLFLFKRLAPPYFRKGLVRGIK